MNAILVPTPAEAGTHAAHDGRPAARPTYRFDKSFEWNYVHGPDFDAPWPEVPPTPMKSFFGLPVRSRFGIPASILPNSRWLETYARLGFDILTYKSVRRVARACGPARNWMFVDESSVAEAMRDAAAPVVVAAAAAADAGRATTAGSFGMPSMLPEIWMAEMERCRAALTSGQVLIASVVGTAGPDVSEEEFVADFADLAARAADAGAHILEINLSCPNVGKAEGQLYLDAALSGRIARAVKKATGGRPLLLKSGAIRDPAHFLNLLKAVAGAADGLVLINGPSRRIVNAAGAPAFGPGRERAGVTGAAVKPLALGAVKQALALIAEHKLPLEVVGCGGVTSPQDVRDFLAAGACAALSATGATLNPYLASQLKAQAPDI
jgi:dihydroorotate dehydrogenase